VDKTFLAWPFFEQRHRALAAGVESWCASNLPCADADVYAACRDLVRKLGRDGWLKHTAPDPDSAAPLDVRSVSFAKR
jgi:acyl-CoA dehydrogenase